MTDLSKTSGTSPPRHCTYCNVAFDEGDTYCSNATAANTCSLSLPKKKRTQDERDRASFIRYAHKHPKEASSLLRAVKREAVQ